MINSEIKEIIISALKTSLFLGFVTGGISAFLGYGIRLAIKLFKA